MAIPVNHKLNTADNPLNASAALLIQIGYAKVASSWTQAFFHSKSVGLRRYIDASMAVREYSELTVNIARLVGDRYRRSNSRSSKLIDIDLRTFFFDCDE